MAHPATVRVTSSDGTPRAGAPAARMPLRRAPLLLLVALGLLPVLPAAPTSADDVPHAQAPYESSVEFVPAGKIDVNVLAALRRNSITPAHRCSDAVFLRRAHIDLTGTLPELAVVLRFLGSEAADKRSALVDELLERDEFVDYWTLKWGDVLRVKAEFPINLWPNGVQAYHRWIHDAVRTNMPLDRFARELLTASGSNYRTPAVNFYRALQDRSPEGLAAVVALTFMGARYDAWPEARRKGMAAFFSRLQYKRTAEWKEEVVVHDPAPRGPLKAVYPDGVAVEIPDGTDPRRVFADWLLTPGNPWFARNMANRLWAWVFGRGIVHTVDDQRTDNPPSNHGLLAHLETALATGGYDARDLLKRILNSRTYQGSPIPRSSHPEAEALFAHYPVRRLEAEVLIDALCRLDGRGETYVSIVPEPFTYLPNMRRSIRLTDGTVTSPFLEMFGRPARDTGLAGERNDDITDAQRLYLLNASAVQQRIERSAWLRRLMRRNRRSNGRLVNVIYVALLARPATTDETLRAVAYLEAKSRSLREGAVDLVWALLNTKEFLYRH